MTHPIELAAADTVSTLRQGHSPQHTEDSLHLAPGVYFNWDAGNGAVTLDVWPEPDMLLNVAAEIHKTPDWLSLNIALRDGAFGAGDVLGLVIDLDGCPGETLPAFIRSVRDGTARDTYLDDPLTGHAGRAVRTLLHTVRPDQGLADAAAFHTLVLPLPRRDFTFELRDLRVFVVPAARGLSLSG